MSLNYYLKHRNPGWIELFFDLSFVIFLGRLAHILFHSHEGHLDVLTIFSFFWIFSVQFLVWMLFTVFINIYGNNSLKQTLFAFVLMLCLLTNATLMSDLMANVRYIALILGFMSLIVSSMYYKSKHLMSENETYACYKTKSLFFLAILSLPVLFMPPLVIMIYTIILYTGEHLLEHHIKTAKPDSEHFIERIGIFIILILGESLMTLINNSSLSISLNMLAPNLMLMAIFFGLFINYFTFLEILEEAHYDRYEEILLTNWFVMFALTLFPAVIYYGITQELVILQYQGLCFIFTSLFFCGTSLSYVKVPVICKREAFTFGLLPTLTTALSFLLFHSYFTTLLTLLLVLLASSIVVLINARKCEQSCQITKD